MEMNKLDEMIGKKILIGLPKEEPLLNNPIPIKNRILIHMPSEKPILKPFLTFEEQVFLALYFELMQKLYNPKDEREYQVDKKITIKVRHVEMQNVCYIMKQTANLTNDYQMTWNWRGPYSPQMQYLLNNLDDKEKEILEFYNSYLERRNKYAPSYKGQLENTLEPYLDQECINKIVNTCTILEDIMKLDGGSEMVASMIYIAKNVFPHNHSEWVFEELQKRHVPNEEYYKMIWKYLALLGVVNIEKKEFIRTKKLEAKN